MSKTNKSTKHTSSPTARRENPLISKKSLEMLQFRLHREEMSVRLYYAMSVWLDSEGYSNAAKLWKFFSDDEIEHVGKCNQYLLALGIKPEVRALEQPRNDYTTLVDVAEETYKFMLEISAELQELAKHSLEEGDFMLHQLALWFLSEQVPAYKIYNDILSEIKIFGSDKIALRLLDNSMEEHLEELQKKN